jgi:hypothetical protein
VLGQQLYIRFGAVGGNVTTENPAFSVIMRTLLLIPLAISVLIRVLVLPRMKTTVQYVALFLLGIVPAGMSGLPNLFLEVPHRQAIFWLCVVVIISYVPLRFTRVSDREHHLETS